MNNSIEQTQQTTARSSRFDIRVWWQSHTQSTTRKTSSSRSPLEVAEVSLQRLTIEQFNQEILRLVRGKISVSTLALYAFSLRALLRVVGNLPIASLGPYHIELLVAQRLERVSAVRVNIEFRALRDLFKPAVVYGMVTSSPLAGLKQVGIPHQEPRALSQKEFARLLSVIDNREFRALVILAVCTAMRAGEISSLRRRDVDLARGVIHLDNREGFRLKGLHGRDIPLSGRAVQILRSLPRQSERVFVTRRGTPYTPHALTVRFKVFVRLAKLPEEIHLHSLRHTTASWMVERNVPLLYVREILGHASIDTTMIYAHSTSDHLRQSVRTLDPLVAL